MRDNLNKTDLRVWKTHRALCNAMYVMLGRRSFNAITVNDLCSEALISRAAFYAHFNDKYDLFKYMLKEIQDIIIRDVSDYEKLENTINQFVTSNKKLITNALKDANSETLAHIREFMASIAMLAIERELKDKNDPKHIIFVNFLGGGLVNLLAWIAENNFPPEINMMSDYLYRMLKLLNAWDAEQNTANIL